MDNITRIKVAVNITDEIQKLLDKLDNNTYKISYFVKGYQYYTKRKCYDDIYNVMLKHEIIDNDWDLITLGLRPLDGDYQENFVDQCWSHTKPIIGGDIIGDGLLSIGKIMETLPDNADLLYSIIEFSLTKDEYNKNRDVINEIRLYAKY